MSSEGVLECYRDIPDVFVIDREDVDIGGGVGRGGGTGNTGEVVGVRVVRADTMMTSPEKSVALSRVVVSAFE